MNLSWTDTNSNTAAYNIWRSSGGAAYQQIAQVRQGTITYSDTGLSMQTTYSYQVRAVRGSVLSALYSNIVMVTTLQGLLAPTGAFASLTAPTQITLTWNDTNSGKASYEIWRSEQNAPYTQIPGVFSTSYVDNNLSSNLTVAYKIRATANGGYSEFSIPTIPVVTPPPPPPPVPPSTPSLALAAKTATTATLVWSEGSPSVTLYQIQTKVGNKWRLKFQVPGNQLSFEITHLKASTTYHYRIQARNNYGASGFSALTFKTPKKPKKPKK